MQGSRERMTQGKSSAGVEGAKDERRRYAGGCWRWIRSGSSKVDTYRITHRRRFILIHSMTGSRAAAHGLLTSDGRHYSKLKALMATAFSVESRVLFDVRAAAPGFLFRSSNSSSS